MLLVELGLLADRPHLAAEGLAGSRAHVAVGIAGRLTASGRRRPHWQRGHKWEMRGLLAGGLKLEVGLADR